MARSLTSTRTPAIQAANLQAFTAQGATHVVVVPGRASVACRGLAEAAPVARDLALAYGIAVSVVRIHAYYADAA